MSDAGPTEPFVYDFRTPTWIPASEGLLIGFGVAPLFALGHPIAAILWAPVTALVILVGEHWRRRIRFDRARKAHFLGQCALGRHPEVCGWCGKGRERAEWEAATAQLPWWQRPSGRQLAAVGDRKPEPDPPEDVRILLADGSSIPAELIFTGHDQAGLAVWDVITAAVPLNQVRELKIGVLPARTTIKIPLRDER